MLENLGGAKRRWLVMGVCGFGAALMAATHSATGNIRHNRGTMKLEAAVAVWKPAENELRVSLLPFIPTTQEIATIRNSGAVFVAAERPGPIGKPDGHPPFAELVIEFEPGTSLASLQKIIHYRLEVAWLHEMNYTTTLNRNSQEEVHSEFKNLQGSLRDGGKLQLALQGSGAVFNDSLDWNFRVDAAVHVKR